ncbi:MAG: tail fiber domain-containing protein [Bacteroidota bacterium]
MNYKQMLLPVVFCCIWLVSPAQRVYQINADTVRIFSSCDTAELQLENRTRMVPNGVLTNKGNGITEFRKVMIKLGDSLYIIGGDTLNAASFGKNIYNANGIVADNRLIDGNNKSMQFSNNNSYLVTNINRPVIISRTHTDSLVLDKLNNTTASPFAGLKVRGTGCDAAIELISDSAGTCNESQMIDFTTLKPRSDSWLTHASESFGDKYLMGRIELQTDRQIADYATLGFAVKSDTAFFNDGAYTFFPAGFAGGYLPVPVMSINPSFKHPTQGYNTKMPFVQVNGGLFVGFGRNWYFNSRNAHDIIAGVDDVAGYLQPFYETRFSVYADSLPLKIYKLPAIRGNAFLTYSPTKTVEGNNVAFEYKDSVYEDIRQYISMRGLNTPSDRGLKENIRVSQFNNNKLLGLQIRDFNYKADNTKTLYTGLLAQELRKQVPELVNGSEGSYSIDYVKMVPYLLKLLQDQQKEIIALQQLTNLTSKTKRNAIATRPVLQSLRTQGYQQREEIKHARVEAKK